MNNTPTELRGVESLLDSLARQERASAPAGLETRVFELSAPVLARARTGDAHREPKAVIARITPSAFRLFSPMRVAAGLALAAAVGAITLAGLRTTAGGKALAKASNRYESLDSKVDSLLAWNSPMGEGFEGLGEQIDLLYADLSDFSIDDDLSDEAVFDGGAL
jgi:hypothetical protein